MLTHEILAEYLSVDFTEHYGLSEMYIKIWNEYTHFWSIYIWFLMPSLREKCPRRYAEPIDDNTHLNLLWFSIKMCKSVSWICEPVKKMSLAWASSRVIKVCVLEDQSTMLSFKMRPIDNTITYFVVQSRTSACLKEYFL